MVRKLVFLSVYRAFVNALSVKLPTFCWCLYISDLQIFPAINRGVDNLLETFLLKSVGNCGEMCNFTATI